MENKVFNLMIMACEMRNIYKHATETAESFANGELTGYKYVLAKMGYGTYVEYKNGKPTKQIVSLTLSKNGYILREVKFGSDGLRIPVMTHRLFLSLVHWMDDDVREQLHTEMSPCTDEQFLRAYCDRVPGFIDFILSEGFLTAKEYEEIEAMGEI